MFLKASLTYCVQAQWKQDMDMRCVKYPREGVTCHGMMWVQDASYSATYLLTPEKKLSKYVFMSGLSRTGGSQDKKMF